MELLAVMGPAVTRALNTIKAVTSFLLELITKLQKVGTVAAIEMTLRRATKANHIISGPAWGRPKL